MDIPEVLIYVVVGAAAMLIGGAFTFAAPLGKLIRPRNSSPPAAAKDPPHAQQTVVSAWSNKPATTKGAPGSGSEAITHASSFERPLPASSTPSSPPAQPRSLSAASAASGRNDQFEPRVPGSNVNQPSRLDQGFGVGFVCLSAAATVLVALTVYAFVTADLAPPGEPVWFGWEVPVESLRWFLAPLAVLAMLAAAAFAVPLLNNVSVLDLPLIVSVSRFEGAVQRRISVRSFADISVMARQSEQPLLEMRFNEDTVVYFLQDSSALYQFAEGKPPADWAPLATPAGALATGAQQTPEPASLASRTERDGFPAWLRSHLLVSLLRRSVPLGYSQGVTCGLLSA